MNDCRFGVSPVNYPDPDPDESLLKFFIKDQNRFGRSFRLQPSILVSVSGGMKIFETYLQYASRVSF